MAQRHTSHLPEDCRHIGGILSRIGDKWSVLVVGTLGAGSMRFSEIKRAIGGISQKMLTATLRGLERDGFVTRTMFPTVPPRVDYKLTALGRDLLGPVRALGDWALANQKEVEAARLRFDKADERAAGRSTGNGTRRDSAAPGLTPS